MADLRVIIPAVRAALLVQGRTFPVRLESIETPEPPRVTDMQGLVRLGDAPAWAHIYRVTLAADQWFHETGWVSLQLQRTFSLAQVARTRTGAWLVRGGGRRRRYRTRVLAKAEAARRPRTTTHLTIDPLVIERVDLDTRKPVAAVVLRGALPDSLADFLKVRGALLLLALLSLGACGPKRPTEPRPCAASSSTSTSGMSSTSSGTDDGGSFINSAGPSDEHLPEWPQETTSASTT